VEGQTLSIDSVGSAVGGNVTLNTNGSVTFTPNANFNGPASFSYIASDGTASSNSATVAVDVAAANDAPTVTAAIADQSVTENNAFVFDLPANTFNDIDAGDTLTYSTGTLTGTLPVWLGFDPLTRRFSGTPVNANLGSLVVLVTATDNANASVTDSFILNVNDIPVVATPILDQSGVLINNGFSLPVAAQFADAVPTSLTFTATRADGNPLPAWLTLGLNTGIFSGMPLTDDIGTLSVKVTATDSLGASASDTFDLSIVSDIDMLNGTADDDPMVGGTGNDTLNGLAGNDRLDGGPGSDVLNGGPDSDTADYSSASSAVNVHLGIAGPQDTGGGGIDILIGIENLTGSAFNDVLAGNDLGNTINGGDGNDVIDGGMGLDILSGNAGNDTFVFRPGQANGDVILDFAGLGAAAGDTLSFVGYGTGATLTQVSANDWRIDYTTSAGPASEIITLSNGTTLHPSDFVI
jgi:Ca2+-binding RTX toxin-like protein